MDEGVVSAELALAEANGRAELAEHGRLEALARVEATEASSARMAGALATLHGRVDAGVARERMLTSRAAALQRDAERLRAELEAERQQSRGQEAPADPLTESEVVQRLREALAAEQAARHSDVAAAELAAEERISRVEGRTAAALERSRVQARARRASLHRLFNSLLLRQKAKSAATAARQAAKLETVEKDLVLERGFKRTLWAENRRLNSTAVELRAALEEVLPKILPPIR